MAMVLEKSSGRFTFRLFCVARDDEDSEDLHEYSLGVAMGDGVLLLGETFVHMDHLTDDPQRLMAIFDTLLKDEVAGFAGCLMNIAKHATREYRTPKEQPSHA